MVAYFVRRLMEGAVALLAMSFVLYSMLAYLPGGMVWKAQALVNSLGGPHSSSDWGWGNWWAVDNYLGVRSFKLNYPWPESYFRWLFDPEDVTTLDKSNNLQTVPKGANIKIGQVSISGSGILTGNWGESHEVSNGQSTFDLMGSSFWLWDTLVFGLTLLGMVFVVMQRRGHRPILSPRRFPFTPHDRASLSFQYTRHSE